MTSSNQVARGDAMTAAAAQSPAVGALMRAVEERAAAERMLVQRVQELMARVDTLERAVARLARSAVQQRWDGRLYLPAHGRLALDLVVNGARFSVEALAHPMLEAPVDSSALPSEASRRPTGPLPPPPSSAGQGVASMAGSSASSWQSIAASNGVANPRTSGPGSSIKL